MSSSGNAPTDRIDTDSAAPPALLELVVVCGDELRTFDLPAAGEVTLGRAPDAGIRIDDPSVSRQHARLHLGSAISIEDLGGANGTFLHARAVQTEGETLNARQLRSESAELAVGDRFVFGTASAVVRHAPALDLPDLGGPASSEQPGVVVSDAAMRALYEQAARAAKATISILLLGETGVGKEVLARSIHAHSPRKNAPFMGINCAALPETLLETELFGCEKGAFTGALQARAGLFEAAHTGTVFLDEIGELPLGTQVKLLRVLEERTVTRVGATRAKPIDVRFIAATNRDIEAASNQGEFRQDLFFRLNGITLEIPPLRERPADLELLIHSLLRAACRQLERTEPLTFSTAALELLRGHSWPGNVRELRNAMERAAVLCPGNVILPEHLPPAVRQPSARPAPTAAVTASKPVPLDRERVIEALNQAAGNQTRAAEILGISRRTLVSRLGDFDLPRPRKRE